MQIPEVVTVVEGFILPKTALVEDTLSEGFQRVPIVLEGSV